MGCTQLNERVAALTEKLAREYKIHIDLAAQKVKNISYQGSSKTAAVKKKSFLPMLASLQPGITYMFVDHPAPDGSEIRAIHHIGYENVAEDRQAVTDLLTDPEVKSYIKKQGIQLISYKELQTVNFILLALPPIV